MDSAGIERFLSWHRSFKVSQANAPSVGDGVVRRQSNDKYDWSDVPAALQSQLTNKKRATVDLLRSHMDVFDAGAARAYIGRLMKKRKMPPGS